MPPVQTDAVVDYAGIPAKDFSNYSTRICENWPHNCLWRATFEIGECDDCDDVGIASHRVCRRACNRPGAQWRGRRDSDSRSRRIDQFRRRRCIGARQPDGNSEDNSGGGSGGGESKPDNEPPTSTVGNGREDNDKKPADEEEKKPAAPGFGGWPKFKHSLSIPVLRLPTPEEVTAAGWVDPSMFFGTLDVPVPTIDGFLSSLSQPTPEPTPEPSFRTQQEAPVLDVTGGGGGGLDPMAAENGAPPVFQLPLVAAPAIPIPGFSPAAPLGASAAAGPPTVSAPGAAAGARAPLIRGTLSPSAETAKTTMTPMSGQATRVGYSRYLRNPTVGQLAAVALPGVAGLMFLTFGGGVIGYRQANSIRFIRVQGAERFLQ